MLPFAEVPDGFEVLPVTVMLTPWQGSLGGGLSFPHPVSMPIARRIGKTMKFFIEINVQKMNLSRDLRKVLISISLKSANEKIDLIFCIVST